MLCGEVGLVTEEPLGAFFGDCRSTAQTLLVEKGFPQRRGEMVVCGRLLRAVASEDDLLAVLQIQEAHQGHEQVVRFE
ncbi:MAG: hypothetical protein ACI4QD_00870 [Kiritimatiellia bacterium]